MKDYLPNPYLTGIHLSNAYKNVILICKMSNLNPKNPKNFNVGIEKYKVSLN